MTERVMNVNEILIRKKSVYTQKVRLNKTNIYSVSMPVLNSLVSSGTI